MNQQLPAPTYLAGNRRRLAEESLQGLGISQPKRISRMSGRFSLIDEAGNVQYPASHDPQIGVYIDVVIVDVNPNRSKIYFDRSKPFDANSDDPPLCWSDNGVGASIDAIQPQSLLCSSCPQNVRGSAISQLTGQPTTACRDQKKFAVLVSGFQGVWLFTVPPASLKKYRAYAEWVMRQQIPGAGRAADVTDLVTRIYFEPQQPNELAFRVAPTGWISPEIANVQDQLWQSGECDLIVGKTDQPISSALPGANLPGPTTSRSAVAAPRGPQAPLPAPPAPPANFGTLPAGSRPSPGFPGVAGPAQAQRPFVAPTAAHGQSAPSTVTDAAPTVPSEPLKRRGRKSAQPVQAAPQGHPLDVPAFLDRSKNPNAPQPPAQQPQFGMAPAQPANADLSAAVAEAFRLT